MLLQVGHRLFSCNPTHATPVSLPDGEVLALGCRPDRAAVLLADGQVMHRAAGAWRAGRCIPITVDPKDAAISACGDLTLVSYDIDQTDYGGDVLATCGERAVELDMPDFIQELTDVHCHPDGQTLGFSYLTSQPWSEFGSYGSRTEGCRIFDRTGAMLREDRDDRAHDDEPRRQGAWGPAGDPLVGSTTAPDSPGSGEVHALWDAERAKRAEDLVVEVYTPAAQRPVVSDDGTAVAFADTAGQGALIGVAGAPRGVWFGEAVLAVSLHALPEVVWIDAALRVHRAPQEDLLKGGEPMPFCHD